MEKGIPWVSFVYREGDGAVFLRPRPVSSAGDRLGEPPLAGKEILYRVDYLEKGKIRRTAGILSARKEAEGFFEKMDRDITDGLTRAGSREFYIFLKIHFILCLLEEYAGKRKALAEKWRREKGFGGEDVRSREAILRGAFGLCGDGKENAERKSRKDCTAAVP